MAYSDFTLRDLKTKFSIVIDLKKYPLEPVEKILGILSDLIGEAN